MSRVRTRAWAWVIGVALTATGPVPAATAQTADWPCPQGLVSSLEPGQMWSGPPLGSLPSDPDPKATALVQRLIDVHLPPETVASEVKSFAQSMRADQRQAGLTTLFVMAFDRLNAERSTLITGIKRYARGQRQLAEKVSAETRELDKLRQEPTPDAARVDDLDTARVWDTRVFTDRQHSLRLVCDQPVLVEQRAFALARTIQEQLP
jgi:hypothetical protein